MKENWTWFLFFEDVSNDNGGLYATILNQSKSTEYNLSYKTYNLKLKLFSFFGLFIFKLTACYFN